MKKRCISMLAVMAMIFSFMPVNVLAVENLQQQISQNNVVLSAFGISTEKITNFYVNEDGNTCFAVLYDNGISETIICPFAGAAMPMATALYGLAQAYNITTYGLSYRRDRFNCNSSPVLTTVYKYREVWYTGANQTGQSATEIYCWINEFL